jgi:hypothetical protein
MIIIKKSGDATIDTTGYELVFTDSLNGIEVWWDHQIGENENIDFGVRVIETQIGKQILNFDFKYVSVIKGEVSFTESGIEILPQSLVVFGIGGGN